MQQVLDALGDLLLKALPTFVIIVVLNFYLQRIFFRPLERLLAERHKATEGARELAEQSLKSASEKAAAYEQALRDARVEVYREQEEQRRQWRRDQEEALKAARESAGRMVAEAKARIESDAEESKRELEAQSDALASQIVERVLRARAA